MVTELNIPLVSHMVEAVRAAKAETYPFPHALIADFFPKATYSELLGLMPRSDEYEPFAIRKHQSQDGSSNRLRFRMQNQWLDRLSRAKRVFWYTLRQAMGSQQLKEAVYKKMGVGLAFRFGLDKSHVNDVTGYALPELFREFSSYRIKPHPDTRRKVVTMQISLPRDSSQQHLGTEFYRRSLNPLHMLREPRGFTIAKSVPFLPNSAYCFSVLNNYSWKSWHGRSSLPGNCGVRDTILNIWYLNAVDANLDLIEIRGRAAAA